MNGASSTQKDSTRLQHRISPCSDFSVHLPAVFAVFRVLDLDRPVAVCLGIDIGRNTNAEQNDDGVERRLHHTEARVGGARCCFDL